MSGGKTDTDPTWGILMMLVGVGGIGWLIWFFFRAEILEMLRYFRFAELWVIGLIDHQAEACARWLRTAPVGTPKGGYFMPSTASMQAAMGCFGQAQLAGMTTDVAKLYYNVTPVSLDYVTQIVAHYTRWPVGVICAIMGGYAFFFTVRNKFKTRHTLESFIATQSTMWPVISPIVKFNPSKHSARIPGQQIPDQLPVFAEAFSPEEWISYHRIPVANNIPDRDAVRRAFLLQLGPRWQGPEVMPIHMQALFAAFALKGVQRRDESETLLGRLAQAWTFNGGFQPDAKLKGEIRSLIKDPEVGGKAIEIANQHAYRTTALLGVLKWARFMGGVLAPAQFLWLRGEDRNLWYPLNNLGRRSFLTEGAGAIAHFMAEQAAQKALPIPRIDTAVITLNQYLAQNSAVSIPPREEPNVIQAT